MNSNPTETKHFLFYTRFMKPSDKSDHCEGSEELQEVVMDSLGNVESQPIPETKKYIFQINIFFQANSKILLVWKGFRISSIAGLLQYKFKIKDARIILKNNMFYILHQDIQES